MYNVSNGTLKVGQAVQYKACALSLKVAEIFRSVNESSPPPLPLFSTFRFLFAISSRAFAVEQFRIRHWKANGQTNLMTISEIKIERLQPEKSRNMSERI